MTKTPTQKVAAVMRTKVNNPLRDNIIKNKMVRDKAGLNSNETAMILDAMYKNKIDGVELSMHSDATGSGGKAYRIENIDSHVSGRVVVDKQACAEIRQTLPNHNTLHDVADTLGFSKTQINHHGTGRCKHDIDTPPVKSEGTGPSAEWVIA